jgi:hypothetical protein
MYAVTVDIHISATEDLSAEVTRIAELIRSAARPEHRLEHLYARPSAHGASLVLFIIAPDLETAEETASQLYWRTGLEDSAGCRLVRCSVQLIVPIAEASLRSDL